MNLIGKLRSLLHKKPRENKRWRYKDDGVTKYEI